MKIMSWNVNGIRSVFKKGFSQFIETHRPDILCLQEIKIAAKDLEKEIKAGTGLHFPGYQSFWNHAAKPGYSGTAVLTNAEPLYVQNGIGAAKHDGEGRTLTLEFKDFYVVNVYVPNSRRDLGRLPYRTKEWDVDFLKCLKNLEKKKPVIFCGDMNVAHKEIDLTYPAANVKNHGFTPEERAGFDQVIEAGFIDTFREFCKDGRRYTWWSPMGNCRSKNIGWRIDYVCISSGLRKYLKNSFILPDVPGSDHCPVGIEIKL